jgi:hypothetical protein
LKTNLEFALTKYIKDKSGKFAGSIGDGNANIPSPQDDVVVQAQKATENNGDQVSTVSDIFAAYLSKTEEMNQARDNSDAFPYAEKVDTSKYGVYEKPDVRPTEWRAADNLTIRWENNPLGFETATVELDMPGLIRGRDNLRDLIVDDKASVAMNNLAAELRRIADEMDSKAFDISLEEDARKENDFDEEDYEVDYFNHKMVTVEEDDEGYFIERTDEYLDEYEDYVPYERSTIDSDPFWDLTAEPPF